MKKRIFPLAMLILLALCITAHAVEPYALTANPVLSFDGTTAECSVSCRGEKATDEIEVTLTLYRGNTIIDSWSESGTFRVTVSGECSVKSGVTYSLVMTWSVNGEAQTDVTITKTCP